MNNVKIASAAAGSTAGHDLPYNERRRKLLINNTHASSVGEYTIGSSGALKILANTTVVISDYIGPATANGGSAGNVKLVELT
mgnify:CR=1 FL=1|jgi:hypothetical protein|tara:strand:- start:769 stop:1017 length:249 start_codon:yes stop_codon:yes gene_type:complete